MVCEDCIKRVFETALQCDILWPPHWGAELLDVVRLQSIRTADMSAACSSNENRLQERRVVAKFDTSQDPVCGTEYQLCPWYTIAICREDSSNHIMCRCGAYLCFICGKLAFHRPGGSNHWSRGGYPRYNTIGSGIEWFDIGQYNNREPHLMPLGYIYGIFLYVNGNDEHFVKVYKDDPKLCWQTIDHKHDLFSEHGGRFFPFWFRRAVACWNFNRAMQMTAKVPHKSVSLKPSLDRNSQPLTTAQRKVVPNIMFSLGTISGNHGRTRENESNSERSHR
jgi:hypothetical protein